jgi:hypothetical protein
MMIFFFRLRAISLNFLLNKAVNRKS